MGDEKSKFWTMATQWVSIWEQIKRVNSIFVKAVKFKRYIKKNTSFIDLQHPWISLKSVNLVSNFLWLQNHKWVTTWRNVFCNIFSCSLCSFCCCCSCKWKCFKWFSSSNYLQVEIMLVKIHLKFFGFTTFFRSENSHSTSSSQHQLVAGSNGVFKHESHHHHHHEHSHSSKKFSLVSRTTGLLSSSQIDQV